jgi:hypothetical protein
MKKYTNIPLKERKRNADRCYRHEARLEEINLKRVIKIEEELKRAAYMEQKPMTDKDLQQEEAYARLKAM